MKVSNNPFLTCKLAEFSWSVSHQMS